jgi:hypothetical protein
MGNIFQSSRPIRVTSPALALNRDAILFNSIELPTLDRLNHANIKEPDCQAGFEQIQAAPYQSNDTFSPRPVVDCWCVTGRLAVNFSPKIGFSNGPPRS